MDKPVSYCLEESKYIEGLHGLRAIACLAIFMVHFGQISKFDMQWGPFNITLLLKNGNTGVALFFLLSGFLLSQPFWCNKVQNKNNSDIWQYWVKRLGRIIPAYYVCLTALIILQQRWEHSNAAKDIFLHYFFLHNFSEKSFYNINPPFWTLAVEMQFYLLLPLFFSLTARIRPSKKYRLFFVLSGFFYFFNLFIVKLAAGVEHWPFNPDVLPSNGNVIQKSIIAHMPHFMLGMATGWLFQRGKNREDSRSDPSLKNDLIVVSCALMVLIILSSPLDNLFSIPWGRYNYPYVPLMLAIIILKLPDAHLSKMLLESLPFRYVGMVSYGVYIYHLPIQRFTERIMSSLGLSVQINWLFFGMSSLSVTIMVSSLSYFTFEKFSLKLAKSYTKQGNVVNIS